MNSDRANKTEESFVPMRRKKGKKGLLGLLFLIVIAAGGSYYWLNNDEAFVDSQPLLTAVQIGDIENIIAATGSLKPFETVEVGAQVSGQLLKLYVDAGDKVEAGQLLAEIYANQQEQRVASSRANLAGQEAQLESRMSALALAQANADRQRRLMAADATSQLDFDNAMNQLAAAQANLIQAQRQIDQSRANLDIEEQELAFTRIVAPIAGTVVSVNMTEGRTLNATQQAPTILTIADLTKMSVEAEISEADISNLSNGMDVYFTTLGGGNRRWSSNLRQILPQPTVTNNVVLYTGLFDIENNDGALLPEMTAQIYFVTSAARDVLTVPIGALTFFEGGPASAGSGFNEIMANAGGRRGGGAGSFPSSAGGQRAGVPDGSNFPAGGGQQAGNQRDGSLNGSSLASIQVQLNDGSLESREIIIGLTSRVSAEVISGLRVGESVVSGVVQGNVNGIDRDQLRSAMGLPGGR
ncbi:MAG: efflux transporter periplasmic adaptor subunit [SAR86 cluster bacterium]|uniref:Efflux transporter periplasmic adaptor subunit n=1 Tax=SAR86 cluster bacterium TaxID=2030880 RepID=A0A2A5CAJ3_9GAMM|nr:MAG: efflux transporter periplasmic adaptor subunit [SAR86 cluster bacterium]